jgi:dipeptidyl aminopeptidase/acylaminoacyl peptidase
MFFINNRKHDPCVKKPIDIICGNFSKSAGLGFAAMEISHAVFSTSVISSRNKSNAFFHIYISHYISELKYHTIRAVKSIDIFRAKLHPVIKYIGKTMKTAKLALFSLSIISSALSPALGAEKQKESSAHYKAMDIFELEYASAPRISPNGKQVIYSRISNDIMTDNRRSNFWIINADGTNNRPLLSGRDNYRSARWSPDGDRVAYLSPAEGSTQLYIRWMDTGQTALISNLINSPSSLSWSPDGKNIAFTMAIRAPKSRLAPARKKPKGAKWSRPVTIIDTIRYQRDGAGIIAPSHSHIFVIPSTGGTARQLTSGDFQHRGPLSWAKDSKSILFSANRNKGWERQTIESDIYSISLNGQLSQITSEEGAETAPTYSPDGNKISYLKRHNLKRTYQRSTLNIMSKNGSNRRILTDHLDQSIRSVNWAGNSKGLYFIYDERAVRKVAYVTLRGKITAKVSGLSGTTIGRPYVSGNYTVSGNDVIAYTKGSASRPADLAIYKSKKSRIVTALNEDALGHKTLGKIHEVIYKSSFDDTEIQGWYITPPNFDPKKKYPLILEIHGGPGLSYGPFFSAEMQQMAAAGYVVFYDNHRGSSGYGTKFSLLLQYKYSSTEDFADHMSGVDAMIAKGFIDEDNLFIAGGSAGGIATAYAVGLTNRFSAAVSVKPVINWVSKTLTADSSIYQIRHQFPGWPWEHYEHYWKRSPLSLVGNVKTPTMIMTGENDRRTPMSETEQYYQALKLLGVDTMMVRVPGSPHGIAGRPSRLIAKTDSTLAWFKRYRK